MYQLASECVKIKSKSLPDFGQFPTTLKFPGISRFFQAKWSFYNVTDRRTQTGVNESLDGMAIHSAVDVKHCHLSKTLRSMLNRCLHIVLHILQPATEYNL